MVEGDEIKESLAGLETRMQTIEQDMAEITSKTKENYDKKYIDQQNQQLQTSITQAHSYTKSLEKDVNKLFTKIIADAKNDNRVLQENKLDLDILTRAHTTTNSSLTDMGKAMYKVQTTVIDLLNTSKESKSFHVFSRELNQKYQPGEDSLMELYEQYQQMRSLYGTSKPK